MADAGQIYYNAITGATDDIVRGMYQYHKEHQAYDQQYGMADALSRLGIDKKTGQPVMVQFDDKGKAINADNIEMVGNPKAIEQFKNFNRRNAAYNAGQLEAYSRLMQQGLSRAQAAAIENAQNPKYPVRVGDQEYPLSAAGAASVGIRREENEAAGRAAIPKEKRAEGRYEMAQEEAKRQQAQFQMSAQKAKMDAIEKRPEIQFSRKYGLTPQAVIGLQETPYVAKDLEGNVISDAVAPVEPGKRLSDLTSKPGWWNDVKSYFSFGDKGKRDTIVFEPKDNQMVFRESLYKYSPSSAGGKQVPSREQHVVNPAGELLNIKGTRVPLDEVSAVQNAATAAQKDLANSLASPAFQSFTPEQKAMKLGQIKDRLSTLGYNPNDAFWGLPQQ